MRLLIIILLFVAKQSFGIASKPILLRACVNYDDSTITISWNSIVDACGSFQKADIYGNDNNGAYQKIATISSLAITNYPHYIPNLSTNRKYFISLHTACNGIDSFLSDTISPDLNYPDKIELDSVSYDVNNQNIIAGWQKNTSIDTRGYQIYDFRSGNGDSIGTTNLTYFTVSKNPLDIFPVVIAATDSCNLTSTLSKPHKPMFLSGTIDTCKNEVSLNWSTYQGWLAVDSQVVYVRTNNQSFNRITALGATNNSFSYTSFTLGDTFELLVRAYTNGGKISSSSNLIVFSTRKLEQPNIFYLSNVTVTDDETIQLELYVDNIIDQKSFLVYKATNNGALSFLVENNITGLSSYIVEDKDVDVSSKKYVYELKLINVCDDTTLVSNLSQSILLKLKPLIQYNSYINWLGGVKEYILENSNDGSTWNEASITMDTLIQADTLLPSCYRIRATQQNNALTIQKQSTSNTVCIIDSMRAYAPSAINTKTNNNKFVVIGTGINHTLSTYSLFNRWGEKLITLPTDQSWDCTYRGELLEQGIYIYTINLVGLLGEKNTIQGTIYVIR